MTYPDQLDKLHTALVEGAMQHPSYPEGSEALAGYSEGAEHALDIIRRRRELSDYSPSIEAAHFRQGGVHEWQSEEGQTDATMLATILDAHVEATLALAYEQHTANLIALFGEGFAGADLHLSDVFKQIKERLGLA